MQLQLYSATTQPVVLNCHDKRNLGDSTVAYSQSEFTVRYVSEIEKQILLAHVSIIFVAIVLQCSCILTDLHCAVYHILEVCVFTG